MKALIVTLTLINVISSKGQSNLSRFDSLYSRCVQNIISPTCKDSLTDFKFNQYKTAKDIQFFILIAILYFVNFYNKKSKTSNSQSLIGVYKLDTQITELGQYKQQVNQYLNLTLNINNDYTFKLNKDVPFIKDSIGTWEPAGSGIVDWNKLYFKNSTYPSGTTGELITRCCLEDNLIYLNSITPKEGMKSIDKIWFRKISPSR